MAYSFAAGTTNLLNAGTGATLWTAKMSVFVRLAPVAADTSQREFVNLVTVGVFDWQFFLGFDTGGTNRVQFGYRDSGGTYHIPTWTSGFTAGVIHTVVGVIDTTLGSNNVSIYADTDATAKATAAGTLGPFAATVPVLRLGNHPDTPTQALAGTLYEVAYWPGVALSGAQAAQLGAGDASGVPRPTDYWSMVSNAVDRFTGQTAVVTGAQVVPHVGRNLYGAVGRVLLVGVS